MFCCNALLTVGGRTPIQCTVWPSAEHPTKHRPNSSPGGDRSVEPEHSTHTHTHTPAKRSECPVHDRRFSKSSPRARTEHKNDHGRPKATSRNRRRCGLLQSAFEQRYFRLVRPSRGYRCLSNHSVNCDSQVAVTSYGGAAAAHTKAPAFLVVACSPTEHL